MFCWSRTPGVSGYGKVARGTTVVHVTLRERSISRLSVSKNLKILRAIIGIMAATAIPSSVSFWRQDWSWYVQQQSWTRSFSQADQNWTAETSASSHLGPAPAAAQFIQSMGSASIANQSLNVVEARVEATGALPSGLSSATGGGRLDVIA